MATWPTTANAQKVVPSAAAGVAVTPVVTAWANSSWYEVTSSMPVNALITGWSLNHATAFQYEIDIGVGAASSEVVVATYAGSHESNVCHSHHHAPIPVRIASGSRVAVRIRKSGSSTANRAFKLMYVEDDSNLPYAADVPGVAPSAAAGASVTPSGTAWNASSWVQLHSGLTDVVALGVVVDIGAAAEFEIEVGIGAASSEVGIGKVVSARTATGGVSYFLPFAIPIKCTGTNRFAVRIRKSGTSTTAWGIKLAYVDADSLAAAQSLYYTTADLKKVSLKADVYLGVVLNGNGTAWANGAWTQLIASTAEEYFLAAFIDNWWYSSNIEYEIDVGVGAASSEVVIATFAGYNSGNWGRPPQLMLWFLFDSIAAGSRVALRIRKSGTTTGSILDGAIAVYEADEL